MTVAEEGLETEDWVPGRSAHAEEGRRCGWLFPMAMVSTAPTMVGHASVARRVHLEKHED